jgi:hypothetical protein
MKQNNIFKNILFHVHYIMLDILIQVNEGIAMFFIIEQSYGI